MRWFTNQPLRSVVLIACLGCLLGIATPSWALDADTVTLQTLPSHVDRVRSECLAAYRSGNLAMIETAYRELTALTEAVYQLSRPANVTAAEFNHLIERSGYSDLHGQWNRLMRDRIEQLRAQAGQ